MSPVPLYVTDVSHNIGAPFTVDPQTCGITKGCYRYPVGCGSHDCENFLTWKPYGNDVLFELDAKITDDNDDDGGPSWFWTAVGFSRDLMMVKIYCD